MTHGPQTGVEPLENQEHRFGLQADASLGLLVKRPVQT